MMAIGNVASGTVLESSTKLLKTRPLSIEVNGIKILSMASAKKSTQISYLANFTTYKVFGSTISLMVLQDLAATQRVVVVVNLS